ncbi:hypothetical protein [Bacteroides sp.]|uniref:hypothetical protein n=1 Tax=Bacteroides sp. TaxID=29523 RepID=UPI00260E1C9F|nr:hypothetical protein [Bacteroides sp.]MDD3036705.1 hypothetical protein [Bacteroides sp.]
MLIIAHQIDIEISIRKLEKWNKKEELKLHEMNEASLATRASYSTGTGMGPNDGMS